MIMQLIFTCCNERSVRNSDSIMNKQSLAASAKTGKDLFNLCKLIALEPQTESTAVVIITK